MTLDSIAAALTWLISQGLAAFYTLSLLGLISWPMRKWIIAYIDQRARKLAEIEVEKVRSELRRVEENFKSKLRDAEEEAKLLRSHVLGGRGQRQALIDKRRLEAAENVWRGIVDLASFKSLALMLSPFKLLTLGELAADSAQVRGMMTGFLQGKTPEMLLETSKVQVEQPFVSAIVWAYYAAYRAVSSYYYTFGKLIEIGIRDLDKFADSDPIRKMLLAALPNYSTAIAEADGHNFVSYLDILEQILLQELQQSLEGTSIDAKRMQQASELQALAKQALAQQQHIIGDTLVPTVSTGPASRSPTPNPPLPTS